MPALLISGGPASYVRREVISEMAEALPHGELTTINAGHFVHGERPDEFVAAVRAFLGPQAPEHVPA